MTDRLKGCTVMFSRDIREDDAEALLSAIRCLRGVGAVNPSLADADDWMIRSRLKRELMEKIYKLGRELAEEESEVALCNEFELPSAMGAVETPCAVCGRDTLFLAEAEDVHTTLDVLIERCRAAEAKATQTRRRARHSKEEVK